MFPSISHPPDEKLKLRAGDILLYKPKGFFGWVIATKTWHKIAHVEVYDGRGTSLASRDGIGVGLYPLRLNGLAYVIRPRVELHRELGLAWFARMVGQPYGWLDLLQFVGLSINAKGIVCSPFAAGYFRACGWPVFPVDPIEKVAPFQFIDLVGREATLEYGPEELAKILTPIA